MLEAVEIDDIEDDDQQELDSPGPTFVEPTENLLETVQIIVPETLAYCFSSTWRCHGNMLQTKNFVYF